MWLAKALRQALIASTLAFASTAAAEVPANAEPESPTVVLVHGAFADPTSWNGVAEELRADGYRVIVPDNPLRGPAYDAAAVERVLADIDGPVVLVGHSYGGTVITNVDAANVTDLVYVAAFAPQEGEPSQLALDPFRFPGSRLLPPALAVKPASDGPGLDTYVAPAYFPEVFAQDLDPATAADMAARQRSLALTATLEPSGPTSWSSTPSWYLVSGEDHVIPPASQRFMAQRINAQTSEVPASHAALVSQPTVVAAVIARAAQQ
ncbi:hydrolase [Nocardia donostiensis]|uniref:alpha/beta fold hydrolase n=1 Tax=Nocardia donostiensis TaxID=1538463 RepID=UPI0009DB37A8|nr:alpha/beta hydrolase [Nocardia donostiensis]OQS12959.1 hydrolase [Nocardia donostiensis]